MAEEARRLRDWQRLLRALEYAQEQVLQQVGIVVYMDPGSNTLYGMQKPEP